MVDYFVSKTSFKYLNKQVQFMGIHLKYYFIPILIPLLIGTKNLPFFILSIIIPLVFFARLINKIKKKRLHNRSSFEFSNLFSNKISPNTSYHDFTDVIESLSL